MRCAISDELVYLLSEELVYLLSEEIILVVEVEKRLCECFVEKSRKQFVSQM